VLFFYPFCKVFKKKIEYFRRISFRLDDIYVQPQKGKLLIAEPHLPATRHLVGSVGFLVG